MISRGFIDGFYFGVFKMYFREPTLKFSIFRDYNEK